MIRYIFGMTAIFVTIFIFFSNKTFNSFLYRTILSVLMVAIYTLYLAPDVALAEAMLGALLSTFVYLLTFKIHSKIKVVIVEIPILCENHQNIPVGLIPEILNDFAKKYNHKIEFIYEESISKVDKLLLSGEVDIAISYDGDFKILEIPIYKHKDRELTYFEITKSSDIDYSKVKKIKNASLYFKFSDKDTTLFEEFSSFYNSQYINEKLKKYKLGGIWMTYVQEAVNKIVELCNIPSPTGYTYKAIKYLIDEFKNLGFKYYLTNKNNLLVDLGHGDSNAIMFTAHVDTLGAMVRSITNKGTLKITRIGGYPFSHIENENCTIFTRDGKEFTGTIYNIHPSVHVYEDSGTIKRSEENMEIVLDQKVHSKEDVIELGIMPGDFVSFDPRTVVTKTGFIKSRHLDDKASAGILIALAKSIRDFAIEPKRRVYMLFTSYEEVGHGGAANIPEDVTEVIAVDMGAVGSDLESNVYSASICAKDSSGPYDYEIVGKLIKAAKFAEVNYTVDIYPYYSSDVSAALRAGHDIKHGLVGPGIYASHGYERTHIEAIEATLKLLQKYLEID